MRKGIGGCQACRGPLAPRETLGPLVLLALWATLDPQAWRALWDRRAPRGPRDRLVPVEIGDLQVPQAPRVPQPSCTGGVDAGAQSWGTPRAAWRRCWPR